ncbi:oxidoreductase [Rhizobium sp. HT1-10]|uniref:oxidoreductase n=1 Tax=Rhizobium sp. HT1-10 TaxID=3111638 RepID=UPI003C280227
MAGFSATTIPSQTGLIALVTGATSGIGFETAKALAAAGAEVIVASRNLVKGGEVIAKIREDHPGAAVRFEHLDLSSLASVAELAGRIVDAVPHIDLLINNAGVMAIPTRHETVDGFEMQLASNYLGHFALTMRLMAKVLAAPAPRIVTISSIAHRSGRIHFDDLQLKSGYTPWKAYSQSKLATLMFSLELERRAIAESLNLTSIAAHPGYAVTGLQSAGPRFGREGKISPLERVAAVLQPFFSQSAAAGALPTLFAATSPEAIGGVMYGPDGFYELKGQPALSRIAARALDRSTWRRLWDMSEELTGMRLQIPPEA